MSRENEDSFQPVEDWPIRDNLFHASMKGVYGNLFDDTYIERLRKHKLGEMKMSIVELIWVGIRFKFNGIDDKWVANQTDKLFQGCNDSEKEATQLATGMVYCGIPLNRQSIADNMHISAEELEILLTSSLQKMRPNLRD